jgi:acetyltransferase
MLLIRFKINSAWQGKGLGTELLKLLVEIGRREGLRRIIGYIFAENLTMKTVSEEAGFNVQFDMAEHQLEIRCSCGESRIE